MPGRSNRISVARYWSPKPWRATTTGLYQCPTRRGTLRQMIGSRKMVPSRMLRMVPFGLFHICLRLNSFTRASSGVIVAHFTATPYFFVASAESTVTRSAVASRFWIPRSKYFRSTSRYGRISFSRILRQMMRVISSPSISTIGFLTLIRAIAASSAYQFLR